MRSKRRSLIIFWLFCIAVLTWSTVPITPVLSKKVTIRVAHAWEPEFQERQRTFDKEFMKRHPNINVKMENMDFGGIADKYTAMAAAGTLPDILYVHYSFAQNFIRRNIFLNLTPYVKRDPSWDYDDIFPSASTPFIWKSSIYGIPYDAGPILPFYNVDHLRMMGVNTPTDDWTFDDFLRICKKATRDNDGNGTYDQWGTDRFFDALLMPAPLVRSWGGEFLDPNEQKVLLDSNESMAGLRWFADLKLKHKVTSPSPGVFLNGKTTFTFYGSWIWQGLKKVNADVANMPLGPAGRYATIFGSGYCISATTKFKPEAWLYLKEYLSKSGMDYMWGLSGRGSPARKSAWVSFEKAWKGKRASVFSQALRYGSYGAPLSPVSPRFNTLVWSQFDSMLAGKKSLEQAVQTIKKEGEPILKSVKYR